MESASLTFKNKIVQAILLKLEDEMRVMEKAAADAREAATHEESVAEDKYDTRGLEASYLAGAQAKRAAELALVIEGFKNMKILSFSDSEAIKETALVELESDSKNFHFFIAPKGGGISVDVDGYKIQVLTPQSRIGSELMGKQSGDVIEIKSAEHTNEYEILKVQ